MYTATAPSSNTVPRKASPNEGIKAGSNRPIAEILSRGDKRSLALRGTGLHDVVECVYDSLTSLYH
jgi:hypothetical protein